jgi:hypothetical protein
VFHSWFRLQAAHNRRHWRQAAASNGACHRRPGRGLARHTAAALSQLIAILRCELSFARVMVEDADAAPLDATLVADIDWMRLRCQAVMAARGGEDACVLRLRVAPAAARAGGRAGHRRSVAADQRGRLAGGDRDAPGRRSAGQRDLAGRRRTPPPGGAWRSLPACARGGTAPLRRHADAAQRSGTSAPLS